MSTKNPGKEEKREYIEGPAGKDDMVSITAIVAQVDKIREDMETGKETLLSVKNSTEMLSTDLNRGVSITAYDNKPTKPSKNKTEKNR